MSGAVRNPRRSRRGSRGSPRVPAPETRDAQVQRGSTSAANVRTLGMVEVVFSYLVSRRLQEDLSRAERWGLLLVLAGVVVLCLQL